MIYDDETPDETEKAAQLGRFERCYPLNTDSPHVTHLLETDERARFYLADMTGLDSTELASLIPIVAAEIEKRKAIPVFVTDLLDYRVLRDAGVIFEALPPVFESEAVLPGLDWGIRRQDIMALIRNKWNPVGETDFSAGKTLDPA